MPMYRRSHRIAVIFNCVDTRKVPVLTHIQRLMQYALINSAITQKTGRNTAVLLVFIGQGNAAAQWNMPAYDTITAPEILIYISKLHKADLAFRTSRLFTAKLRHRLFG